MKRQVILPAVLGLFVFMSFLYGIDYASTRANARRYLPFAMSQNYIHMIYQGNPPLMFTDVVDLETDTQILLVAKEEQTLYVYDPAAILYTASSKGGQLGRLRYFSIDDYRDGQDQEVLVYPLEDLDFSLWSELVSERSAITILYNSDLYYRDNVSLLRNLAAQEDIGTDLYIDAPSPLYVDKIKRLLTEAGYVEAEEETRYSIGTAIISALTTDFFAISVLSIALLFYPIFGFACFFYLRADSRRVSVHQYFGADRQGLWRKGMARFVGMTGPACLAISGGFYLLSIMKINRFSLTLAEFGQCLAVHLILSSLLFGIALYVDLKTNHGQRDAR